MGQWTFYRDERDEHRWGLGRYAGERKYVSAEGMDVDQFPYVEFINEQCDNINLIDYPKGLWCEHCCHYHAIFKLKGIEKVYQPLPQNGYNTPAQTFINPGKYRSDWTSDDECYEDPYPDTVDLEKVDISPGENFWERINLRIGRK